MYENCPKRYYHQRIRREVQDTGSDATIYGERIHEALEHRLESKVELPKESEGYEVLCRSIEKTAKGGALLVEQKLTLNEDLTPTGWWDGDAWVRSILDVLVLHSNTAVVMDWKTGKRRPDFTQLELFALQVFSHFPEINTVKSSFLWLKDMQMDSKIYHRDELGSMWGNLLQRISRIEQSLAHDKWPPKPSGLCNYCPAKNICEYAQ